MDAPAYVFGASATNNKPGGWDFWADSVSVVRQHQNGTQVFATGIGDGGNDPSQTWSYGPSSGFTTSILDDIYLLVTGLEPESHPTFGYQTVLQTMNLKAQSDAGFQHPGAASPNIPLPAESPLQSPPHYPSFSKPWPSLAYTASGEPNPITLSGNISVYVYGMDFVIQSGTKQDSFQTGLHHFNEVAASNVTLKADTEDAWVVLNLTNAHLVYRPANSPYSVSFAKVAADLTGQATMTGATGMLSTNQDLSVQSSLVSLDLNPGHAAIVPTQNPADSGQYLLQTSLDGRLTSYTINGMLQPVIVGASTAKMGTAWLALSLLVLVCAGATVAWTLRRRRWDLELLILTAEDAVRVGRFRRALRMAQRAIRISPAGMDLDALVIRCVARLHLKQPGRARDELTQAFQVTPDASQVGILHLLASICWLDEGRMEESGEELKTAFRLQPDLIHDVNHSPIFQELRARSPWLARKMEQDSPSYG